MNIRILLVVAGFVALSQATPVDEDSAPVFAQEKSPINSNSAPIFAETPVDEDSEPMFA